MKKLAPIGIIIGIILTSCGGEHGNYDNLERKVIDLYPESLVVSEDSSIFFNGFDEMVNQDGGIFIFDQSPRVMQLDSDAEIKAIISSVGRGPGEFTGISDIAYSNDSLYVYDASAAKIIIFDKELAFTREFRIDDKASTMHIAVDRNTELFLSTPFSEYTISKVNAGGKVINRFGERSASIDGFNVYRNERQLIVDDDRLISVATSEPYIWIYDLEGNLQHKSTINHPMIVDRVKEINEEHLEPAEIGYKLVILFYDAVVFNSNLYLLCITQTEDREEPKFTFVLKYGIKSDGSLEYKNEFRLFNTNESERLYGSQMGFLEEGKFLIRELGNKNIVLFENEAF